jgi:hypothetical protein
VTRKVGLGLTIRSIAVDRGLGLIAASIQSARPAESTDATATAMYALAVFDLSGTLLNQIGAARNRYATFDEEKRAIRTRKPFIVEESVLLSVPGRSNRDDFSVVEAFPLERALTGERRAALKRGATSVGETGFRPPTRDGIKGSQIRMLNVVPVIRGGKTSYVAAWIAGDAVGEATDALVRDRGHVLLTVYAGDGPWLSPDRATLLPVGQFVAEITSTQTGQVFAIVFDDITKGWSISEVIF